MQTHRINWIAFWFAGLAMFAVGDEARGEIPIGRFTDVKLVPNVNSADSDGTSHISADGLTLYIASDRPGTQGGLDLWQATRPTVYDLFGDVMHLGPGVNGPAHEVLPTTSYDDRTLYFTSNRPEGEGSYDIYKATRPTVNDQFGEVMNLEAINTVHDERPGHISDDGLTLYLTSDRPDGEGGFDAYMATRENLNDPFASVTTLGSGLNSPFGEQHPSVSSDELIFFFSDPLIALPRPDGQGGRDMWIAVRTSTGEQFGNVVNLNDFSLGSNVNGPFHEVGASISHDWPAFGSQLFFTTNRTGGPGGLDIWQATWVTPDFDQNGVLDCLDIDALVTEIAAGTHNPDFDLNVDGFVNLDDRDVWLTDAGAVNLPSGNAYLVADFNLDGHVDGLDFIEWNANKFSVTGTWSLGDANGDGITDGLDFIEWNANKFMSSDSVSAVPEPGMGVILIAALTGLSVVRRRCFIR